MEILEILNRPITHEFFEEYEFHIEESRFLIISFSHFNDDENIDKLFSFFIAEDGDWEVWKNSGITHIIIEDFQESALEIPIEDFKDLVNDLDDESDFDSQKLLFRSVTECKIANGKKIYHTKEEREIRLTNWGEDHISIWIEGFIEKTWATYRGREADGLKIYECDDSNHCFRVNLKFDEDGFVDFEYLTFELMSKEEFGVVFFGTMDYYLSEMFS